MKLSVIILNYNVRFFLEQCIVSVERALENSRSEIIVIDNNSSDGSCAMVREKFPHLRLIENKENVGFSKANNQAVEVAQGEYVCILNPDTAIAENTFRVLLPIAEAKTNLGALGVHLIDGRGCFLPESKRNFPTPQRSLLKLLGFSKGKNGYYARHLQPDEVGEVEVLVGAFMLLKRSVYEQVGGFDEDYFMYGEDIDLSYKLIKTGYKNHYYGKLPLLHYKGESTSRDQAYMNRFYGAMKIFYKKHFKPNFLLKSLVSVGVGLAKFFKPQGRRQNKYRPKIKEVLVFTESIPLMKQLSHKFGDLPVRSVSKTQLENALFTHSLCVFDADYVTYGQILSVMHQRKNKQNSFRIKPPGCNFVIGSDQSDQKGTVLEL